MFLILNINIFININIFMIKKIYRTKEFARARRKYMRVIVITPCRYLLTSMRYVTDITFPIRQIDIQERWFRGPFGEGHSVKINGSSEARKEWYVGMRNDQHVSKTNAIFGAGSAVAKRVSTNWFDPTQKNIEFRFRMSRHFLYVFSNKMDGVSAETVALIICAHLNSILFLKNWVVSNRNRF